jgi:hypothetical protein
MRKGQIGARHVAWMRGAFERIRKPASAVGSNTVEVSRKVRRQRAEGFIGRESNPCHA